MKIKLGRYHLFALVLIVLTLSLVIFIEVRQEALYPSNLGNYNQTGTFTINPETIISSIDRGAVDIFTPVQATSEINISFLPPGSVLWTQSDYLKIAAALHEFVWKESIFDWGVYYLTFDRECRDNLIGFDSAELTLFKPDGLKYLLRRIEINPLAGEVAWGAEASFPRPILGKWNNIDLSQFSVNADQALQIAEEHGGREDRAKDKNGCKILIRMPNTNNDERWDVSYYSSPNFEILIDPYTGEDQILESQQ